MNALQPIVSSFDDRAWESAIQAINTWRGHALHVFTLAEAAVTETLLAMAAVPRGAEVPLQLLAGQRFKALEEAIAAEGPFASEGERCRPALAAFREHDSLRAFLCHGTAKVFLGRGSDWLVTFNLITLGPCKRERTREVFERHETVEVLSDLKKTRKELESRLRRFREGLGRGPEPA